MRTAAPRALASLAFALALAGPASPQGPGANAGTVSLELGAEELRAGVGLPLSAAGGFGLRLDADAEAAEARAFLELGGEGEPALAVGPGAPAGVLRFLADPAAASALSIGPPVAVDRSMETGRAALMLAAGGLRAYAIGADARALAAAAAGVSFGRSGEGGGWSAAVDASSRDGDEGGGGWSPDPRPDRGGTTVRAAFVARRSSPGGTAAAAIAASAGRADGPGLAARVQARGAAGPVSLNVSMGAAAAAYRGLLGRLPDDAFRCRAAIRLDLRRASWVSAALEAWAEREGRLYAPSWGLERSVAASVAAGEGLACAASATLKSDPAERAESDAGRGSAGDFTSAELRAGAAGSRVAAGASKWKLSASAEWKRDESGVALDGIGAAADIDWDDGSTRPSASMRLKARIPFQAGSAMAPIASGGIALGIPLGRAGELTIRLDLPSAGVRLSPLGADEEPKAFEASIGYRASLSSP